MSFDADAWEADEKPGVTPDDEARAREFLTSRHNVISAHVAEDIRALGQLIVAVRQEQRARDAAIARKFIGREATPDWTVVRNQLVDMIVEAIEGGAP